MQEEKEKERIRTLTMKAKIIVRTRTLIGTNALHVHLQYQMLVSTLPYHGFQEGDCFSEFGC